MENPGYILTHDCMIVALDINDPEQNKVWNEWRKDQNNALVAKDKIHGHTVHTSFLDLGTTPEDPYFFASTVWRNDDDGQVIAMKCYRTIEEAQDGHEEMVKEIVRVEAENLAKEQSEAAAAKKFWNELLNTPYPVEEAVNTYDVFGGEPREKPYEPSKYIWLGASAALAIFVFLSFLAIYGLYTFIGDIF